MVFDAAGEALAGRATRERYAPRLTDEGGAEMDADELFGVVLLVVDRLLERMPRQEQARVAAVAPTTFWHSLVGVDSQGAAVTPVLIWADARSRDDAQRLAAEPDAAARYERTGCPPHWSYWPAKLLWLGRTQPEARARVRYWLSFWEYAALRLTGRLATSVSMASGTGLMDQGTLDWDRPLLERCGIAREELPPVEAETGDGVRLTQQYAVRWPHLALVPWLLPVGDGASSNVGAGCTSRDRAALMLGTSGALRVAWRDGAVPPPAGLWTYRVDANRVVVGGALNDGGALHAWLRTNLKLPVHVELEAALLAAQPFAHGLDLLPFWSGERAPGWAPDARGAVTGLRLATSAVDVVQAALEAVALQFTRIYRRLGALGEHVEQVIATGGAALKSPAWMQILADALQRPVYPSAVAEGSSRGAALLALERLGLLHGRIEGLSAPVGEPFQPRPQYAEAYAEAAERTQRLYELLVAPRA